MFNIFKKNESGQSMVLVALIITVLFGFGALAVDVGNMTYQKSLMQNAADAAALAGAQYLPIATNAKTEASKYIKEKNGLSTDTVIVNTPYLDPITNTFDNTKVEVIIKRTFQNSLAQVLSPTLKDSEFTVRAVAQGDSIWNGQSLPFLNMLEPTTNNNLDIWDMIGPGVFESLHNTDVEFNNGSFTVTFADGITVKNGTMANGNDEIKDNLAVMWDGYDDLPLSERKIYCFSLSPDVIKRGYVYVEVSENKQNDDGKRYLTGNRNNLGQGDTVKFSELVLLECLWVDYSIQDTKITLDFSSGVIYDLGNTVTSSGYTIAPTDLPTGSFGYSEVGTVKLVE